jgi:hypothetical protein
MMNVTAERERERERTGENKGEKYVKDCLSDD